MKKIIVYQKMKLNDLYGWKEDKYFEVKDGKFWKVLQKVGNDFLAVCRVVIPFS